MSGFTRRAYGWGQAVVFVLLGGFLVLIPTMGVGYRGAVLRLALFLFRYLATWVAVAMIIRALCPTFYVASAAGLQTVLQVLPATLVAVLVLVLGSVAVVAQLAASTWGTRAPVLLSMDDGQQRAVLRPLVLVVATLSLAGQVPADGTAISETVAVAVTTVALATVVMILRTTSVPVSTIRAIAPRSFPQFVIEGADRELDGGSTDLVVLRVGALAEMLKLSLKREDSIAVLATLEAMVDLQRAYLDSLGDSPSIRSHQLPDGPSRDQWLADDLVTALVRAAEMALRDLASAEETNAISRTLETVGSKFVNAGEHDGGLRAIEGLIELATSAHQLGSGGINFHGPPAQSLARLESAAEDAGAMDLAAYALAGWALAVSYPQYHFDVPRHPLWEPMIHMFGQDPPWKAAAELVASGDWHRRWGYKQYQGPESVLPNLGQAEADHAVR